MGIKDLPECLIVEILSRLPVKSLLRFRCVCKLWCALIIDPDFVKTHLTRSLASNSNLTLIFKDKYLDDDDDDDDDADADDHLYSLDLNACQQQDASVKLVHPFNNYWEYTVVGSCNGLLCLSDYDHIFLWNPCTRRHHQLPFSPLDYSRLCEFKIVYGFGYDPTNDDYKLVRIVSDANQSSSVLVMKVYSLSTNSWTSIRYMPFHCTLDNTGGVLVNSALHWVGCGPTCPFIVVSFDLKDEEPKEVPVPHFFNDTFRIRKSARFDIGELGGQLCLVVFYNSWVKTYNEVWVMKDYGVMDSWVKLYLIEQPIVRPICYSKNGEVILENVDNMLVLYDPRRDSVTNLWIHGLGKNQVISETVTCVGSLVPLDSRDEWI